MLFFLFDIIKKIIPIAANIIEIHKNNVGANLKTIHSNASEPYNPQLIFLP